MALKVWLPLNGNPDVAYDISDLVKSIGTSGDIILTRVGGHHSFSPGGKLGYALSFIGAASDYLYMPGLKLQTFSWACWFKCTNDSVATSQRILSEGRDTGSRGAEIWVSQSGTTLYFQAHGITHSTTVELNKWYHAAFTCGNGIFSSYLNGNLINSSTYTADCDYTQSNDKFVIGKMAYNYTNSSNYFPFIGQINDVRIYDHCLSAKEVKEISQGLILHYKLNGFSGEAGENLLSKYVSPGQQNPGVTTTAGRTNYYGDYGIIIPATENADTYFRLFLDKQLEQNTQYTISCEVSGLLSGSYYKFPLFAQNNTSMGVLQLDHNGLCSLTFTMTYSTQSAVTVNGRTVYICFMDDSARSIASGQGAITIKNFKLEKGSIATSWTPAMSEMEINTTRIIDSSGYGNDGIAVGSLQASQDSERYGISTAFAASSAINCGRNAMVTDSITVNLWAKYSTFSNLMSCTESGGWNFENSSGLTFPVYVNSVGYVHIDAASRPPVANYANAWHMFTGVYDRLNQLVKLYIDGELIGTGVVSAPNPIRYHGTNCIWVNAEATGSNTAANYGNAKLISDVRIYATALSAEDILDLYYTPANIDNLGGVHGFEFVEDDGKSVGKNGIVHTNNICQINDLIHYCQYDNALYFEPDGSAWMHIYHHNNPGGGSFASTDTFSTGVYKDENRWFDGTQVCNSLTRWEFLIKYKFTSTGTEYKERWIQSKNPEEAVYGDVDAADITRITTDGYKIGTWGGLYKKNNSAYWVMNNGNSGNWWGATCAFSVYQSGTPGYGGTVTTTGVNDLYVRIDNLPLSNFANASITKDGVYKGNNFIEK